ncbi:MAG: Gfo/Idh/MocA family oxidoreductase [Lentisphaeria bacterium]|nr:Gfo/Idh/MocA family oxidoreductase [Lentisphaeria bacterium]
MEPTPAGTVRYGIIGTGMIARMHAEAIQLVENAELTAVYDTVGERARNFALDFRADWEGDFDAFLAREDIDAVTVATPSGARADMAIPAARAGKHLLCEKPLEVTTERVDAIIEACWENNVILGCVFQSRMSRSVRHIRQALDSGRFGRLVMANVQVPWFRTQSYYDGSGWRGTWKLDGGGALMNQSIHIVDLLLHFMGEPESLCAYCDTLAHERIEVEDTAVAAVRFKNRALATVTVTTGAAPGFPRRLEICGTQGSVVMTDDRLMRWQFVDQNDADDAIFSDSVPSEGIQGGASDPAAIGCEGHRRQIEDLTQAILEGSQPAVSGVEARRAVEFIRGIYQSAETGEMHVF